MTDANNQTQNFNQNDEIDLLDLIASIWQGKWIIIASTIIATILGLVYYLMSPAQLQAQAELISLTKEEAIWLDELSTLPGVNLNAENVITFYTNNIKDEQFIEQFIETYFSNQLQKFAIESPNEAVNIKDEISQINANANSGIRMITGARITFSSAKLSPTELKKFITAFFAHVSKATKSDVVEYVREKSSQYQDSITRKIAAINLQKQIVNSQYQEQLDLDIAQIDEKIIEVEDKTKAYLRTRAQTLKNQITIAKKLNIERPNQAQEVVSQGSAIINSIETGAQPLFMQGYIALEEELAFIENNSSLDYFSKELRDLKISKAVLENRNEEVIFDPEIIKLNGQLLKLKNDIDRANYSSFLNEGNIALFSPQIMKVISPFDTKDFIKKTSPRKINIVLAILAGGFFGLILVFVFNIVGAVRKKLATDRLGQV